MAESELVWIPLYIDRLLSSPSWQAMKDFQRGWYIQLLLLCVRSKRLGYLPLDGRLWEMAGAHSRAMWESHKAAVMACFQTRTFDGTVWIYNNRLLHTIEHQHAKLAKTLEMRNKRASVSIKSFTKPTLQEVIDYCIQRRNNVTPEDWLDHYESNGWMVGRVPMKNWKAAVRTWERGNYGSGRSNHKTRQPSAQVERFHNNRVEFERAFGASAGVGRVNSPGSAVEAPRLSAGDHLVLDGEIRGKKV